jgi:hypothetical protein
MSDVSHRKRLQRLRDKAAGWTEVTVKVAAEHADTVRSYAAQLPPPRPPADPRQLELLAQIDRQIAGQQGSLL